MSGRARRLAAIAAAALAAAYVAAVVPVRWADSPGEARATLAADDAVRDGRPTYAAGCVDVRADGETWANLAGARYLVRTVDAVGDGSVWVFVNGTFVAWADGPGELVTACAPAELAAAIGEAQP